MKQVFMADDGTPFDTTEECDRYESVMGKRQVIKDWVESHYDNTRLTKKHLNVILTWESFRDDVLRAV